MSQAESVSDKTEVESGKVEDSQVISEMERAKLLRVDDIAMSDPLALLKLAVESADRILSAARSLKGYASQTTGDQVVFTKADSILDEVTTIRVLITKYEQHRKIEMQNDRENREWERWV